MDIISEIEKEAKKFYEGSEGCHGWEHTERVRALCTQIGREENANLKILELAAILHDIGRKFEEENEKICHAEKSAELARAILAQHGAEQKEILEIAHCIECHRFRGNKIPQSKEAKILFESDKLDAIGAIGIGRAFLFGGEHNLGLSAAHDEFNVKLSKIKKMMQTETGKKVAEERHAFMETFFERMEKEIGGEL